MNRIPRFVLTALLLLALSPFTHAQSQTIVMQVNVGPAGSYCGSVRYYCYDVPLAYQSADGSWVYGSMWIDYSTTGGFTLFRDGMATLGTAQVASGATSTPTGTTATISGTDSTGSPYGGTLALTTSSFVSCSHGCRSYVVVTGGTVTINY